MGAENCVIANGTPENIEALGNCGIIYGKTSKSDLVKKMKFVLENPEYIEKFGRLARDWVIKNYSWDSVTKKYERLFKIIVSGKKRFNN